MKESGDNSVRELQSWTVSKKARIVSKKASPPKKKADPCDGPREPQDPKSPKKSNPKVAQK